MTALFCDRTSVEKHLRQLWRKRLSLLWTSVLWHILGVPERVSWHNWPKTNVVIWSDVFSRRDQWSCDFFQTDRIGVGIRRTLLLDCLSIARASL